MRAGLKRTLADKLKTRLNNWRHNWNFRRGAREGLYEK